MWCTSDFRREYTAPTTGNDTKTNLDINLSFYRVPRCTVRRWSEGRPGTGGPCTVTKLRPNVSLSSQSLAGQGPDSRRSDIDFVPDRPGSGGGEKVLSKFVLFCRVLGPSGVGSPGIPTPYLGLMRYIPFVKYV
jgi:hypothetical protein